MWLIYDIETGEPLGDWVAEHPGDLPVGYAAVRVPGTAERGLSEWDPAGRGFVDPPMFNAQELLMLFTVPERGAARRMLFATWPPGHPFEGQLIDPEGQVQVALDGLLARREPLALNDPAFTQAVDLLQFLGILSAERAAKVRAGKRPEQD